MATSTLKVNKIQAASNNTDLTLEGSGTGTVIIPAAGISLINANVTGNLSVSRSLAVGYTDGRVPQANLEVKGNVYIDGNTHIRDQQILSFGTGKDLKIYHDGGNSYINDTGTGSLSIKGSATLITNTGGQTIIAQQGDGAVLYYAGMTKLETVPSGIIMRYGLGANVEGNVSVSRSLAVGYTDGRVPQANLEVKGNAYITGATTIAGNLSVTGTATPLNSQSVDYTGVIGDANGTLLHASGSGTDTFTIPANSSVAYVIGTMITFVNESSGNLTIAITSDTMTDTDGNTGSRTLAENGIATAIKTTATTWRISGVGMS